MGLLAILSAIIILLFMISYLKVVYEYVRSVKIPAIKLNLYKNYYCCEGTLRNSKDEMLLKQAPGPFPWPILGNLALIGRYKVPFQGFTELAHQFGDVYSLTLGTTRVLVVNNMDLIREVLNQNGKYFGGRPNFTRYHQLFGGDRNNSLALCDWSQLQQKRRNLARKHCSPRDASSLFSKMCEVGCMEMQEFMNRIRSNITPGKETPLKPLIMLACANMFSQYMCSTRFAYDDAEFMKIVRNFDEIFWEINQGYAVDFLPWLLPIYACHMKKIASWTQDIRKFILQRIISQREVTNMNIDVDEPVKDFTDALLKSLAADSEVTHDTIMYMLEDFLGGHSAIGNLVMLALGYIVRNPEVGVKIQREINDNVPEQQQQVRLSDQENLPYTVATIFEVLRSSSSPIVPHVATEDACVAGYAVTKGTMVIINNYELNTSSKYWQNPEIFDPSRFLEEFPNKADAKFTHTKYRVKKNIPHFLPFSIGKRTCIGQSLVRGFSFIMLANLLKDYNITCRDPKDVKTYPACVAVPPNTFSLVLHPRQKIE